MVLRPIGRLIRCREDGSEIRIYKRFCPGLDGLSIGDQVWVMFWMHKLSEADRKVLHVHPMADQTKPKRGVFALHSPMRPNPIGLTRVRLIGLNDNILLVSGLDAFEGTPILDIKPA